VAIEVNDAVETAHRNGILSAASLMVGAAHSADAVARAKRLPTLRVGLHLTLVEQKPVLPVAEIPDLVDGAGCLRSDLSRFGAAIMAKPRVRRQMEAEIRAQFEAFRATGLALDHVNAHRHYHLHPAVLDAILRIGPDYGMRALRVPHEPISMLRRIDRMARSPLAVLVMPWSAMMSWRVGRAGLTATDRVFGLCWSGRMTEERIANILRNLPDGTTEIYTHPATSACHEGAARGYLYAEELAALVSPRCRRALKESGALLGGYSDLPEKG
jgi:chitin disaccharide deacetylase